MFENIEIEDIKNKIEKKTNNLEEIKEIINLEEIISFISSYLSSLIVKNKLMKKTQSKGKCEPFYNKVIPALSLKDYLIRIMKYTEAEKDILIVAFLYILKLIKKENFIIGINNIYILLLSSVILAKKTFEDYNYKNSYYCQIGGISLSKLNLAEYSLFARIDFELNIKLEDIDNVYILINSL